MIVDAGVGVAVGVAVGVGVTTVQGVELIVEPEGQVRPIGDGSAKQPLTAWQYCTPEAGVGVGVGVAVGPPGVGVGTPAGGQAPPAGMYCPKHVPVSG